MSSTCFSSIASQVSYVDKITEGALLTASTTGTASPSGEDVCGNDHHAGFADGSSAEHDGNNIDSPCGLCPIVCLQRGTSLSYLQSSSLCGYLLSLTFVYTRFSYEFFRFVCTPLRGATTVPRGKRSTVDPSGFANVVLRKPGQSA